VRNWFLRLLLLPISAHAQGTVNVSVSNVLRYGVGKEVVSTVSTRRDYVENLTETRIQFREFLVGFRLLYDAPPEYGVEFAGVRKRYLEFRKDDLYIRAGDSYSLFGRGLALNLFESRPLAYDTGIDGIKMEYHTDWARFKLTGGNLTYIDNVDLSRSELYKLRAGSIEITPLREFSLGVNFVSGRYEPQQFTFPDQQAKFDIPEFFGGVRVADIDLFASYVEKRTSLTAAGDTTGTHKGYGFYGSISYTAGSFGVSFEYKDYRFGIVEPFRERGNKNRARRAFAFQNAPIVHKEHSYTLLTRYPHVVDYNDEVGYQVDVFYSPVPQMTLSLNLAASSRHHIFQPTGDSVVVFGVKEPVYGRITRENSFLPSFKKRYSPFWELYADVRYYFEEDGNDYVLIGLNRRSDEIADEVLVPPLTSPKIDATRTTAIPVAVQYTVADNWVVKFVSEHQRVYERKNSVDPRYYNQLFTLSVSRTPQYAVALRYEFTTDKGTVDRRKDWSAIDVNYRLSNKHTLTFTVGGDRGGQVCANGVCRFVNPFLGVRASLVSYL
jgi:hypothetical protein